MREPGSGDPRRLSVTCAIMAYNEEASLEAATRAVREALTASGRRFEILIIDDGSEDRTADIARALARRWPEVELIQHERNRGPGSAIVTGLLHAREEIYCFHPADNQLIFADVVAQLPLLDAGYDVLVGERSDRHDYSLLRRAYSYGYIGLIWLLFGLRGFRDFNFVYAYRRSIFERIDITTSGLFLCTEVLIKAVDLGLRATTMRARYLPRRSGVSTVGTPSVAWKTLQQIVAFRRDYRRSTRS